MKMNHALFRPIHYTIIPRFFVFENKKNRHYLPFNTPVERPNFIGRFMFQIPHIIFIRAEGV
jgi:hypothetical protein